MTALDVLTDLRSRGVTLAAAGDKLRYRPVDALTSADLAALREHKADLLALLEVERLDALSDADWYALVESDLATYGQFCSTRCYARGEELPGRMRTIVAPLP